MERWVGALLLALLTAACAGGGAGLVLYPRGGSTFDTRPAPAERAEELPPSKPGEKGDGRRAAFLEALSARLARLPASGAGVAVVQDGVLAFAEGMGRGGPDGEPATLDTLFRWGGLTRVLTAATLLKVIDESKHPLVAPLPGVLPSATPASLAGLSLHHLLTDTAGLFDDEATLCAAPDLATVAARTAAGPRAAPAGAVYLPSRNGYAVAGAVLEAHARQPFEEVVRRRLLRPAGMVSATFDPQRHRLYAQGTSPSGATVAPERFPCRGARPAAGLLASAAHLGRLLEVLLGRDERVLSAVQRHTLLRGYAATHGPEGGLRAYGLTAWSYRGLDVRSGADVMPGFAAAWVLVPARRFGVALAVSGEVDALDAALRAVDVFLEPTAPNAPVPMEQPLGAYAGAYQLGPSGAVLAVEAGAATLRLRGAGPVSAGFSATFFPGPRGAASYLVTPLGVAERMP